MSYKTILVHVDDSHHAAARIRLAAGIALAEDAHLVGAAMTGISRFVFQGGFDVSDPAIARSLHELRQRAARALTGFDAIAVQAGVASIERRVFDDEPADGICLQARYSDLVVISQTDPDEPVTPIASLLDAYVVLNSGRPVLIVPRAWQAGTVGKNVLVGWDGGMQAARAISGALPLLARAQRVDLAVFNPADQPYVHGADPGSDIAQYLARHGARVNVLRRETSLGAGEALLAAAAELSSDLIVMGGYGHSRFREVLLGGATRTLLDAMTVPVLMAH